MKLLALDAGLAPFSAAVAIDGRIWSDRSDRNDALEAGLGRIAGLLDEAGIALHQLGRIAVGIGPGSFTGLRIAVSFAKSLAYAAGVGLVGISSYDVLTPPAHRGPLLTVVVGRPGVICARLTSAAIALEACGATAEVFTQLLGRFDTGTALDVVANTEDAFPELDRSGLQIRRLRSPARENAAVTLIGLAQSRVPNLSLHGIAPDYGESPVVTVPKSFDGNSHFEGQPMASSPRKRAGH